MSEDNELEADNQEELSAAGWDAIDARLAQVYPGVEPLHYGTIVKWALGGPDPLDGVSIFKNPGPPCHWHYISYGLTELYHKESENDEYSGYGFELTFRLKTDTENDQAPPTWPIVLMQNLARYVFETGNVFDYGHRIPLNSPVLKDSDTLLCGAMFAVDPQLGVCDSTNGIFTFLQIVTTTADELDAAEAWNTKKFIDLISKHNPLMVTDLSRKSILEDPQIDGLVKEGIEKDGSSCGTLYVADAEITAQSNDSEPSLNFKLLRKDVSSVRRLIAGRLLHGRSLTLISPDGSIMLVPAEFSDLNRDAEGFVVNASPNLVQDLLSVLDSGADHAGLKELANFTISTK